MTKLHDVTLSDEAVRFAAAQVASGRFRSMDDALEAGLEALRENDARAAGSLETALAQYRAREHADTRDLTAAEASACLNSADPDRRKVLREHLSAVFSEMEAGRGEDMDDEAFASFLDDCVEAAEPRG